MNRCRVVPAPAGGGVLIGRVKEIKLYVDETAGGQRASRTSRGATAGRRTVMACKGGGAGPAPVGMGTGNKKMGAAFQRAVAKREGEKTRNRQAGAREGALTRFARGKGRKLQIANRAAETKRAKRNAPKQDYGI